MQSVREAPVPAGGFVHQALIYGSDQEFMEVALPFVEGGLGSEEPTLVAVQRRHVESLRAALGGTPGNLTLLPVEDWFETSARSREKFARWAAEWTERGGRVRLIGEPPWAPGHEARVRDWARHESVINVTFEGVPVTFICPYDARSLPEEILSHAHGTHPEIASGEGVTESNSYEDPLDFCRRLDCAVEAEHGEPSLEMDFGLQDLPAVRRAIELFAGEAGLVPARTEELVLAVNEITTNAVIHGRPPATVRVWGAEDEIVVEVGDAGDGIRNVLAGQLAPPDNAVGGRGLWLTRLLCDSVEVGCDKDGCSVTMRVAPSSGDLLKVA